MKSGCQLMSEHEHAGSGRCGFWSLLLRVHSANELDSFLVSWFNECCILECTPSEKFLKVVSVWIYPTGAVDLNALKLETN